MVGGTWCGGASPPRHDMCPPELNPAGGLPASGFSAGAFFLPESGENL